MLRLVLGTVAVLSLCAVSLSAADTKDKKDAKAKPPAKATITKVDAKKGTITVKMKDKDGKDAERVFRLTEDVRYFDSTGKAVAIDVFESGNDVLVIEREGKLKEMHKDKVPGKSDVKKPAEKAPSTKVPAEKK